MPDAKKILDKIKKIKGLPLILIALAAGLILLLLPSGGDSSGNVSSASGSTENYVAALESKTEALIRSVDGVGDCKVMITVSRGYEYYYASDQKTAEEGERREAEKKIVIIENGGNETPVIIEERMPAVTGVAVVCPGISAETEYKILTLLTSLFDVGTNKISITK